MTKEQKKMYDDAMKSLEDSIRKNSEDQTKQITTIGWAGMMFLVSMNAERLTELGCGGKFIAILTVILFNIALILEFAVCMASIKSSEHLGLDEDIEKIKGLKWYRITRKLRSFRDCIFLLALLGVMVTIIFIIISQSMNKNENKEQILGESHVSSPVVVNTIIQKPTEEKQPEVPTNFSHIPSQATVKRVSIPVNNFNTPKESEKK